MSNKFDYKEFAQSMAEQAMSMIPSDLSEDGAKYLVDTIKNYTHLAGEAFVNDSSVSFTDDEYVFATQIIAEWTFHKCVDLARSDVDKEYWDSVMQKIAFTVFEIVKQGILKKVEQQTLLDSVEHHVLKAYKESLQELCERGVISDSVFEKASELSNIDDMAEERKKQEGDSNEDLIEVKDEKQNIKKKKETKKVYKFSFFKKIFSKIKICLVSILDFIKTSLESIMGFVVLVCNKKTLVKLAVILAVYGAYKFYALKIYEFINQIYNISSETLDIVVSIALGLGILTVIIKTFIQAIEADVQAQLDELEEVKQELQDLVKPNKMYERLGVDVLCLQVGAGLLCIADPDQEGDLLAKTAALRQMLTDELGYIIPEIRIMDSSAIDVNEYVISVRQNKVASGFVYPDKYMVIADEWENKGYAIPDNAICGIDPANEVQAYWIDKEDIEDKNFIMAVSPTDVIKTHLKEVVIKYVNDILSTSDINKYIALIEDCVGFNANIAKEDVRKIFVNLIREKVSIKDIALIFDRLNDYTRFYSDSDKLSEMLRKDFSQQICLGHSHDSVIYAVRLSQKWETILEHALNFGEEYNTFYLSDMQKVELVESVAMKLMLAHQDVGYQPVLLCPSKIRLPLYRLLVDYIPTITVLAESEISVPFKVDELAIVEE